MNKFGRKLTLLAVAAATAITLAQGANQVKAAKTTVTWFVGLGTGAQAAQIDAENKVVADFNAANPDIELKINIAASNQAAPDALSTLIASGNAPDIVGPVGVAGSNSFAGEWLDLNPLIKKTNYNMAQFPDAITKIYTEGNGQYGIPFAVYPGLLYYNIDLFKEAGLANPPKNFGDKYKLDGKDVDWSWDTVATIAKRLTVDSAGNDATSAKFDPSKTVQFGFDHQWDTIRSDFQTFGGAPVIDPTTGKVKITDAWRAEAKWMYDGLWTSHFIPNTTYINSDLLKPTAFGSGKVAMTRVMLWYTCCLADDKGKALVNFDLAPVPSYNGKTFAPADADSFRIDKHTANPDASFKVLSYLLGDGALTLLQTYGAYPARADLAKPYIDAQTAKYPSVTNWAIVKPSLDYNSVPHHESAYPNFNKGQQRFADFATLLRSDSGSKMDVDKELDKLQSDLQSIVDQAGQPAAAATMAATK